MKEKVKQKEKYYKVRRELSSDRRLDGLLQHRDIEVAIHRVSTVVGREVRNLSKTSARSQKRAEK